MHLTGCLLSVQDDTNRTGFTMNYIQPCWVPHEPGVAEMLDDPVVKAIMRADGVDRDDLAAALGIEVHRVDRPSHATKQEGAEPW